MQDKNVLWHENWLGEGGVFVIDSYRSSRKMYKPTSTKNMKLMNFASVWSSHCEPEFQKIVERAFKLSFKARNLKKFLFRKRLLSFRTFLGCDIFKFSVPKLIRNANFSIKPTWPLSCTSCSLSPGHKINELWKSDNSKVF